MKPLLLAAVIILSPVGAGLLYADSDGYYCIGRGYLAYQFGMDTQAGPPPRLYVIRMSDTTGIPEPMTLDLPRFQVHGMRCGAGWVNLAAFSALYHVILDETRRPVEYEVRSLPYTRKIVHEFSVTPNLGSLSGERAYLKPVRERLRTRERGGGYFLEINAKLVSPLTKCELSITSRVIETDRNGREINARIIFEGRGYRECE